MVPGVDAETPRYEEIVLPALLGEARKTYGAAIRRALGAAGFDDMPRAGARIVGGIARQWANVTDIAANNGISKQAASQLVDTLVTREYVARVPHGTDRRRMTLALTERGEAAAREIRAAVEDIDARLAAAAGAESVARVRAVLGALVDLGHDDGAASGGGPPAPGTAPAAAPGRPTLGDGKICYLELPAVDIERSAEFYEGVFGWRVRRRGDGRLAFDDAVGEVSGTWVLGRPAAGEPGLLVYVMVDSVAAAIERVVAAAGELVQPIGGDAPEITARIRDPAGNVIGLYQEGGRPPPGGEPASG